MSTISITWVIADENACPICKAINGYTWTFPAGQVPNELYHPEFGPVWNITEGSKAHEHFLAKQVRGFCRCGFDVDVSMADMVAIIRQVRITLEGSEAEGIVKADVFQ